MRALPLAAAALLLLAPAALAGPVKDGSYEAEQTAPEAYDSLTVVVSRDGRSVKFVAFKLPTRCRIRGSRRAYPTTLELRKPASIAADGSFSHHRIVRYRKAGIVQRESFKGRFAPDGRSVTLTGRFRLKRRDGTCDTKTRTTTAPLRSLANQSHFAGPYAATSAAGDPISFTVTETAITDFRARLTLQCSDGSSLVRDVEVAEMVLEGPGRFFSQYAGGRVETFETNGTVYAEESKTDANGAAVSCSTSSEFKATPVRLE